MRTSATLAGAIARNRRLAMTTSMAHSTVEASSSPLTVRER